MKPTGEPGFSPGPTSEPPSRARPLGGAGDVRLGFPAPSESCLSQRAALPSHCPKTLTLKGAGTGGAGGVTLTAERLAVSLRLWRWSVVRALLPTVLPFKALSVGITVHTMEVSFNLCEAKCYL